MTARATIPERAERAISRAAHDANARRAAGAVAGAGAAIAATKAALDRRHAASDDEERARVYRLRRKEPAAAGIRRVAEGRADDALAHLRGEAGTDRAEAVHETRKDLKKLRSVLRLVRDELGPDVFRRENDRLRNVGRLLAGARDAQVKRETLESLWPRLDGEIRADGMRAYADALNRERQGHASANGDASVTKRAITEIEASRAAIAEWPLASDDWSLVAPGLMRGYRRGRDRFAETRDEATDEAVHEWRKRVKDLWYQLRIVRNSWKPVLRATGDQAHDLADLLGDHHDLAVLRDDAFARDGLFADGDLERLLAAISERQDELVADALALGERLYAEKPKAFGRRLGTYWRAWR
jgi:CHAD domain-containing protein